LEKNFKTFLSRALLNGKPSTEDRVGKLWGKPLVQLADGLCPGWILKQMTTKTRRFLITTQQHEVFIVRVNSPSALHGFCPQCATEVELLTFDSAVQVSGVSGRAMIRQLATGEIHSIETANSHLLVCRNSLQPGLQRSMKDEQESKQRKANLSASDCTRGGDGAHHRSINADES
jgi:hypothetical protein